MTKELEKINPLKDRSNPRSVINITPNSISTRLEAIPEDIFEMGEGELKKAAEPTIIDERLRIAFWREYDNAQATGKQVNLSDVYTGVCSQSHFLKRVITNSFKLAYVLTPPTNWVVANTEMLNLANEQIREILAQPNYDIKGNPNTKLADVKMKIWNSLQDRVKGAVVHRSESLNLNLVQDASKAHKSDLPEDLDEIEKRLAELESLTPPKVEIQSSREVIDVETEDTTSSES